jgi:hypothetical protein
VSPDPIKKIPRKSSGKGSLQAKIADKAPIMMMAGLTFWSMLLVTVFFPPDAPLAQKPLTLQEVEKRMVQGGYLDTLRESYWAAAQGEAIVPLLATLLKSREKYQAAPGGATGAFPFNVLWALAHIGGAHSLKVLTDYYADIQDETAALAIKGHRLRAAQKSGAYGILINEAVLLSRPSQAAGRLKQLRAGQQVKILKERIANPREEGPRGGPALFDRVKLWPSGEPGYIPRAGDDFSPFI